MPKISVIMPIYNTTPEHLHQAVSSILRQTFTDFEFLILNDSPKNLKLDEIVKSFGDKRIRYIKSEHSLGVADAHNKLLAMAKGKYIAVMDHDDISLADRLARQYAFMEAHKDVGICGTAYRRFGKLLKIKTIKNPEHHDKIQASLLFKCPIHHPSSMIRKKILDDFHICYDNHFISLNDRKLYLDISKHAKLHNLQEVLYKYRMHPLMTSKVHRYEIMNEQLQYRESLFKQYGVRFTQNERHVLNGFIFNGRCKIDDGTILEKIGKILEKLVKENQKLHFSDQKALEEVAGAYLVKRCKSAAFKSCVSSKGVLAHTKLPVCPPLWLKVFNKLKG